MVDLEWEYYLRGRYRRRIKTSALNGRRKRIYPQRTIWQRPRCQRLVLKDESLKQVFRLSRFFSAFPKKFQWHTRKRMIYLVYGGGSAPVFHGIPY